MTVTLLLTILASLGSAALAVALTRTVLRSYIMGVVPDMIDEEWRDTIPMTKRDAVLLAVVSGFTTYVVSTSLGGGLLSFGIAAFMGLAFSITYIDFVEHWIPNVIVYPLYLVTALALLLYWNVEHLDASFLLGALTGGVGSWVLYMCLWKLTGERLGFGDVRYSAVIGAITGGFVPVMPIFAIFFANFLGLAFAILGMLIRVRRNDEMIAFGPFMTMGAVLAILYRAPISEWWVTTEATLLWLFSGAPI
jgi:prepilin signal peptidase PulO-like enzyme (type II secretory pathway)